MSAPDSWQEFEALARESAVETRQMELRDRAIVWRFLVIYVAAIVIGTCVAFL